MQSTMISSFFKKIFLIFQASKHALKHAGSTKLYGLHPRWRNTSFSYVFASSLKNFSPLCPLGDSKSSFLRCSILDAFLDAFFYKTIEEVTQPNAMGAPLKFKKIEGGSNGNITFQVHLLGLNLRL